MSDQGWIGVDLDGTLAEYHGWVSPDEIGKPIPTMLERVKSWIQCGKDVRIFTARGTVDDRDRFLAYTAIQRWCRKHLGRHLPITNRKDIHMVELWDDRCVQIEKNTGRRMDGVA